MPNLNFTLTEKLTPGAACRQKTLKTTGWKATKPLTADKELASEWSRIPHFYTPFYVYKYATGYSAATAFAEAILSGKENAVEKYLGFLKAGGSDYSLNILKNAGVDLTTPQPVAVTLQKFAQKVQELKTLLKL